MIKKTALLFLLLTAVLLASALAAFTSASALESPEDNPDVVPDILIVLFAKGTTYEQMVERLSDVCRQLFPDEEGTAIRDRLEVTAPTDDGIQWTTLCCVRIEEERCSEAYLLLTSTEGVESVERDYWCYPDTVFGDLNDDGSLDVIDYILLKKAILSTDEPNAIIKHLGDVNRDGVLDSIDYIRLKKDILNTAA